MSALGLTEITFFGQDWGGLIGLRVVGENPELFAGVIVGNALTALLGWARSLIGLPPSKPPPKVKYEQLRLADVMHWLSGGLFEKRLHELTSAERVELRLRGVSLQAQSARGQHVQFGKWSRHVSVLLGGSASGPTIVRLRLREGDAATGSSASAAPAGCTAFRFFGFLVASMAAPRLGWALSSV